MKRILIPLLALLVAGPTAAQEWQVAREQFVFVDTRLTIRVAADAPGTLRLIRGEPGSVRVASRSRQGFTTSGLSDDDQLTLSAAGEGPVDYLVAVPENVWVDVRLPGTSLGESVARGRTGNWEWGAAREPQEQTPEWLPGTGPGDGPVGPLYTTFSRDLTPREVAIPDLSVVARVSVRLEGQRFRVITSRPLAVDEGSPRELVIRPAGPPMAVILAVPRDTPSFTLRLAGRTALILDGDTVTTLCTPVIEQQLSDDRRWFTFNPLAGSLDCSGDTVQRHGG